MLLIPLTEDFTTITKPPGAVRARLIVAAGMPQHRTWSAQCEWRLRNGKVHGEAQFHNHWLSGLLDQLAGFEEKVMLPHTRFSGSDHTTYRSLRLYFHQSLYPSIRNTVKRYCQMSDVMLVQKPN